MTQSRGSFIQTYTGRHFYPADPQPDDIDVEDIAHALSNICRFTGHTRQFYCVAQHVILGAIQANTIAEAFEFLHHDDSEAYVSDLARPTKQGLPDYCALENRVAQACATKFDLPWPHTDAIKQIDARMLVTEASQLMTGQPWWLDPHFPPPFNIQIVPWSPHKAKAAYLRMHAQLSALRATKTYVDQVIEKWAYEDDESEAAKLYATRLNKVAQANQ
jgi:uncharacterized protein